MLKRIVVCVFALFLSLGFRLPALGERGDAQKRGALISLGEKLFKDDRFSTPSGDLPASCSNCHLLDEDPQGVRAYTDFFNRSWISARSRDIRRFELRNSPTILDSGEMTRLHYDGEFASLEDLVKGTFAGRPMGWLPGEEMRAFENARSVLLKDQGEGSYRARFKSAFSLEVDKLGREEAMSFIARAVAEYCRTLKTRRDSPYDLFIKMNGLDVKPAPGESAKDYSKRLLAKLDSMDSAGRIKFNSGFDKVELQGARLFFKTEGEGSAGNCASCHIPPSFTDLSFHNKGVSQREYDGVHGDGAFARMTIPGAAEARRPSAQFREIPSKSRPGEADLGFWNFVDLKSSPLRQSGESDDHFLRRMIAAFKTPTLRNLKYSNPYLHDGSVHTIEDAVIEIIRLSELAREGRVREADAELARIRLNRKDVAAITAFLNSLTEEMKR